MITAESRAAAGQVILTDSQKLTGQWMVFNDPSEKMMMERDNKIVIFREIIEPSATDNALMSDVKCCADHRENEMYLGRTPNSLRLEKNERGWQYECDLMDGLAAVPEVRGLTARGDYGGNSFKFYAAKEGDKWEKQLDGSYLRHIQNFYAIVHVGPVKNPAYLNTDVNVAYRSLENSGMLEELVKADLIDLEKLQNQKNYKDRIINLNQRQIQWMF